MYCVRGFFGGGGFVREDVGEGGGEGERAIWENWCVYLEEVAGRGESFEAGGWNLRRGGIAGGVFCFAFGGLEG